MIFSIKIMKATTPPYCLDQLAEFDLNMFKMCVPFMRIVSVMKHQPRIHVSIRFGVYMYL